MTLLKINSFANQWVIIILKQKLNIVYTLKKVIICYKNLDFQLF